MKKISFDKKGFEDSLNSGKEKVNEKFENLKRKNYGNAKVYFLAIVVIVLIGLGFYFHIIQNIFYSLLSMVGILIVLGIGVGWEYLVFTYLNEGITTNKKHTAENNWEKLEQEFELYTTEGKKQINQLKKYSLIHYMASIGLLVVSCVVMSADWIYGTNFSQLPYAQDINPSILLAVVLAIFSVLFMVLYYLNQKNLKKHQDKFLSDQRYFFNLKSAYLLGKENLIEQLLLNKKFKTNKQVVNSDTSA